MIPQPLEEGGYEGFGELTDRANSWLKDQSDILVTNMQSLTVQKNAGEPPHPHSPDSPYYLHLLVPPSFMLCLLLYAFI